MLKKNQTILFLMSLLSFVFIKGVTGSLDANISWFLALSLLTIWAYQTIAHLGLFQIDPAYIESFLLNTVLDSVIIAFFDICLLMTLPEFRDRIRKMI